MINIGDKAPDFTLKDKDGNVVSANWTASKENICTIDGNKITGLQKGKTVVRCTYNGIEYECIVRVR